MRARVRAVAALAVSALVLAVPAVRPAAADASDGTRFTQVPIPVDYGDLPDSAWGEKIISGPGGDLWTVLGTPSIPGWAHGPLVLVQDPNTGGPPSLETTLGPVQDIAAAPDGTVWCAEMIGPDASTPALVRMGDEAAFPLPAGDGVPTSVAAGPDGKLWFAASNGFIGELSGGSVTQYPVPGGGSSAYHLARGADGDLWFTQDLPTGSAVGRITPGGAVTLYPLPAGDGGAGGITLGPDGNVWFTEQHSVYRDQGNLAYDVSLAVRVTPDGQLTVYPLFNGGRAGEITPGPDGNLWIAEGSNPSAGLTHGELAMISTAGEQLGAFWEPGSSEPIGVAAGSDGDIWSTDSERRALVKLDLHGGDFVTVLLTPDSDPVAFGQEMNFVVARVFQNMSAGSAPDPSGSIVFTVDGVVQPALQFESGMGVGFATAQLSVGLHRITAQYFGDTYYAGATSGVFTQTVDPAPTSMTMQAASSRVLQGDPETLTVTESPALAGSVQFYDGSTRIGAPVTVDATGSASFTTGDLAVGDHSELTAAFTPSDPSYAAAFAGAGTVTVFTAPFGMAPDQLMPYASEGASTATTPVFSAGPRLLVAFVSSDGPKAKQSVTVSGAGLTWTPAARADAKGGTAEIWTAFAPAPLTGEPVTATAKIPGYDQELYVIGIPHAAGVGATAVASRAGGVPGVRLSTTAAGSVVFGVGEDYTRAVEPTVGSDQSLLGDWVDTPPGETFWLQQGLAPATTAGTTVPVRVLTPSGDTWNLAAVEVVPAS